MRDHCSCGRKHHKMYKKKKPIDAKKDSFFRVNEDMMFLLDNLLSSERGHLRVYANYWCDFYSV